MPLGAYPQQSYGASSSPSSADPIASSAATPVPHLVRGVNYNFPAVRTLLPRHFDAALQEISASISEDMSSLGAIKKFDEQFGDKKGKKGDGEGKE